MIPLENLITNDSYSIKTNNEIVNNWPSARVPYVSTADIAKAAFEIVAHGKPSAKEVIILGPEAITCEEVRSIPRCYIQHELMQATFCSWQLLSARSLGGKSNTDPDHWTRLNKRWRTS